MREQVCVCTHVWGHVCVHAVARLCARVRVCGHVARTPERGMTRTRLLPGQEGWSWLRATAGRWV